jgi:DNA-binding NarL/FixJ family response regulator
MKKTSIVVVDDHKLIREMWVRMFAERNDVEISGEAGELDEAVEIIRQVRPDIVLLDINLFDKSGLEAVPQIRKYSPGSRIIAVSMHNQPAYAKKILQLGASGYVTKNSSHTEIFKAVEEVMNGHKYVCTEIKNILSDQILETETEEGGIKNLSLREIEVIKLINKGHSSKEIAAELNISVRTIEVHRHNILKKLKLKNTASLLSFINENRDYF